MIKNFHLPQSYRELHQAHSKCQFSCVSMSPLHTPHAFTVIFTAELTISAKNYSRNQY